MMDMEQIEQEAQREPEAEREPEIDEIAGRLGLDAGAVKIHRGGRAAERVAAHGARAFAEGDDVYFGEGEFDAGTPEGRALITHELAHVAQARAQGPAAGSRADSEHEADAAARGEEVQLSALSAPTPHFKAGGKQGSTVRQRLLEERARIQTALKDVQGIPAGQVKNGRVEQAMGALLGAMGPLVKDMEKLPEGDKKALRPVAMAVLVAAGQLAAVDPAQRASYLQVMSELRRVLGDEIAGVIVETPGHKENLELARAAIESATKEIDVEAKSFPKDPPIVAGPIGLEQLAVAAAVLSQVSLEEKKQVKPSVEALTTSANGLLSYLPRDQAKARLLRARLDEVRSGAALDAHGLAVGDIVKEEQQVEAKGHARDFKAVTEKIQHHIDKVYNNREIAVGNLISIVAITDPVVHSIWEDLVVLALTAAGEALLTKALGWVGGKIRNTVHGSADQINREVAWQVKVAEGHRGGADEVAKIKEGAAKDLDAGALLEKSLSDKGAALTGKMKEAAGKALRPEQAVGAAQDAKIAFFSAQKTYLADERTRRKDDMSDWLNKTVAAELERAPDAAMATLAGIARALEQTEAVAQADQEKETTARYAELIARGSQGTVQGNITDRWKKDVQLDIDWELHRERVGLRKEDQNEKRKGIDMAEAVKTNGLMGLEEFKGDHANGVISIELASNGYPNVPAKPVRAWATGLNQMMRRTLSQMTLGEMKLPIRARGVVLGGNATFARNELGEVWSHADRGTETWCRMKLVAAGQKTDGNVVDKAAELVIGKELANQKVWLEGSQ